MPARIHHKYKRTWFVVALQFIVWGLVMMKPLQFYFQWYRGKKVPLWLYYWASNIGMMSSNSARQVVKLHPIKLVICGLVPEWFQKLLHCLKYINDWRIALEERTVLVVSGVPSARFAYHCLIDHLCLKWSLKWGMNNNLLTWYISWISFIY